MTKALPFTILGIRRAIEAVRQAGLPITATSVNVAEGIVTVHHQEVPVPTVATPNDDEWKDA